MKMFNKNRPLEVLIIHSQLMCQNDAMQSYRDIVRVPSHFTKFRYEKLYRVAQIKLRKLFIKDYEWFLDNMN